jgi:isopenicillin-N N-acyltransferase like protein
VITVVKAEGTGRELGRSHGEAAAEGIGRALELYDGIARLYDSSLEDMRSKVRPYVDAARTAVPHLADEVEGLAVGAGISSEDAWVLNCFEEVVPAEACTTMIHGRFLMHAEQWYAGHNDIVVLSASPSDGPSFLSPTCAGFLPAVGMSSAGFAQGIDSLGAPDERVGIPRLLISRLCLGSSSIDDAITAASISGRAGGYAHVMASRDRGVALETTATRAELSPVSNAHTNHYLSAVAGGDRASEGSLARHARATELLRESAPTSLEECTELLSDHRSEPQSICVHEEGPEAEGTVFGMVCDVQSGTMLVSDGPPCRGRWQSFELESYSPA